MCGFKLLPVLMISKRKVNDKNVDYEDYLIELLNLSPYFGKKVKNEFKKIRKQSNGEADAIVGSYTIDFKLLVPSQFMLYGVKSLPDVNYKDKKRGFIFIKNNEFGENQFLLYKIYINYIAKIAKCSKKELLEIRDEKDIVYSSVKNMRVDKNILIFIPCNFDKDIYVIPFIIKTFSNLLSIRDDIKKETFIVFLQNNYFNIYEYSHGKYIYRECIPQLCTIKFNDLYLLTQFT